VQAWLFNHVCVCRLMPEPEREYYALGTTSNESLHREFNVLFDLVHNIYAPVMRLRLRIFQMHKLLAHNRSMYAQACRQVPRAVTHRSVRLWCISSCVTSIRLVTSWLAVHRSLC
jgi:hypothetical protein